jgi:glycosyltransferase involved in cell wall biosynthesis
MKVMHLIHDLRRGGAEHVLVDLAGAAPAAGIELSVVSMRPIEAFDYARRLHAAGVKVDSLGLAGWWDPAGTRRLRSVVSEWKPDVLHSHLKHADVIAGRVAAAMGIPHVSTLHLIEDEVGWVRARKRDLAIRSRLRTANRTIAVSDAVREWYLGVSGADPTGVVTLRNGVPDPGRFEPDEIAAIREEFGVPRQAVFAVMVAVMRPGKGHDTLIDAMSLVQNESVIVACVGSGESMSRLQERAAGEDRVQFLGFRTDVARVFAAADLVIQPSRADALPTALVHALAAGKPIIATPVGGIPEIVTDEGGMLVRPGDPGALAAAIDLMVADPDRRRWMGKQNRERYETEFRVETWADGLRRLYDEVVAETA